MQAERVEQLVAWMRAASTTGDEAAYLELLERDLSAEGWALERQAIPGQSARWNLLATWPGGAPEVILCTHVDTVPPYVPPRVDDGAVWGRGACDTKGVLLAMVEACARVRAERPELGARVGLALVVGEEVDHVGAEVLGASGWGAGARRVILGEPTRGEVARAQKGVVKVRLVAEGVAGHSAFPERGVSAVHRLLGALERVRRWPWPDDPVVGKTLLNVGVIEGGVAANVFAPSAEALVHIRVVTSPDAVLSALEEAAGEDVRVELCSRSAPQRFEPPEGEPTCVVAFNSDAAWLGALGPVWLVGPGDIRVAHRDDEHIRLDDLEAGAAQYARLIRAALGA